MQVLDVNHTLSTHGTVPRVRILNQLQYCVKHAEKVSTETPVMDLIGYVSQSRYVQIYVHGKPRTRKRILIFDESIKLGHLVYQYYTQEYWQRHKIDGPTGFRTFCIKIEPYSQLQELMILATIAVKRKTEESYPPSKRMAV